MSWQSLPQLLQHVAQQPTWQQHRQFQQLLRDWPGIVGDLVAQQTRPISLRRGVLCVATASSVWAQNLSFERQRILAKLNAILPQPVTDIRFSTAQWSEVPLVTSADRPLGQAHPSFTPAVKAATSPAIATATTPDRAFQHWQQYLQHQRQQFPLCPQCQCPTPPGELARWTVCALCIRQANTPPDPTQPHPTPPNPIQPNPNR